MPPKQKLIAEVVDLEDVELEYNPASKIDIWIPIYIGDFLADTAHLDATASGAYLLLLFHCWRKGAILNNLNTVITIGKLHGENAPSIAQALLEEFFEYSASTETWTNPRLERERMKWRGKRKGATTKAKKAARARWGAPSNA